MSSLNIALSIFSDTHVSVFNFSSSINLSLLLLLLSFIPGESDHVSYKKNKSSCSIYELKATLGHLCVVLTIQGLNPMFHLYPDPIIVISIIYCVSLIFFQFLVTLVIRWRIYYLPYHNMVSIQYFLMTKTYIFDDCTSRFTFIIGEFLCFNCRLLPID